MQDLKNTQHSIKQGDAASAVNGSYIHTFTRIWVSAPHCGVWGRQDGASGCCVDLESLPLKRAGGAPEGGTAVKVSAVWQKDSSSNSVYLCFLNLGDFITKNCGAGDRLCQPACLCSFGRRLTWNVSSSRCVLYYMHSAIFHYLQPLEKDLKFLFWFVCELVRESFIKISFSTFYLTRGPVHLSSRISFIWSFLLVLHFLIKAGFGGGGVLQLQQWKRTQYLTQTEDLERAVEAAHTCCLNLACFPSSLQ